MFPVEKLSQFESTHASYRILKPWWDVFTDYLTQAILIIALSAGAMQALQGDLICIPAAECNFNLNKVANDSRNSSIPVSSSFPRANRSFCQKYYASATRDSSTTVIAFTKLEDRRQYDFVDVQCGQEALHWFASYLPFILFLQAAILVIVDNFWLKFPKTSSTIDHFVKLVLECFDSSGICLDVSNVLWGTSISDVAESNVTEDIEQGTRERDKLLPEDPVAVRNPSTEIHRDPTTAFELSEAIKAKTLLVKIQHFRKDVESHQKHRFLVGIYLAQAFIQCVLSLAFFIFNVCYHNKVRSIVKCNIDGTIDGHYDFFKCSYGIAAYFRVSLVIFYVLITPYCLLCVFMCLWTAYVWKFKTPFSFKEVQDFFTEALKLGDINDAHGDLALMLHLLNEYNKLYVYRFAVFLSEKHETSLKNFILWKEWPLDELQRMSSENGTKLKLNSLSGIPKTIFQLSELKSLTLEDCTLTEKDFDPEDWRKLELRSLSLVRCRLKSIPEAIFQNCEFLETLDLSNNMIKSVPENIAALHNLHTLNIAGNQVTEGVEHIMKIDSLTVLNLRGNNSLQNVPNGIVGHPGIRKLYVNGTVVSNMSAEMKQNLQGVINTGRRPPKDITVIEYSPSKVPHIEKVMNDREKVYKMTSKPKGLALIFKVVTYYHEMGDTYGSDVDGERLEKLFKGIGYNVQAIRDPPSARDFETHLKDLLANHAIGDSVVVAVLARASNEGMICCNGDIFSVNKIVSILGNADIYRGKPKLIFIQACRGSRLSHVRTEPSSPVDLSLREANEGMSTMCLPTISRNPVESDAALPDACQTEEREDSDSLPLGILAYPDVLIGYSTLPDFVSYRGSREGSWYIQSLVEFFSQYAFEEDVLSLLTFVNYNVSRKFKTMHGFRQIPAPQSTLTKKLFFLPGYFEDDNHSSAASTSI
ncbi:PREDICTED: volume-regulated anion channel subunit LRRC8A-like [Acropora digitifera]|uniref:volume-regulated anion channel subunit LRRC8A-like n=1 Tax=Acropora digitifera TaxID=70779 RepID=UPI00077B04AE|nr:PREDICTED: volume-regulated anion channel subunit LRRC8A-like [Acropora digitifera]